MPENKQGGFYGTKKGTGKCNGKDSPVYCR